MIIILTLIYGMGLSTAIFMVEALFKLKDLFGYVAMLDLLDLCNLLLSQTWPPQPTLWCLWRNSARFFGVVAARLI